MRQMGVFLALFLLATTPALWAQERLIHVVSYQGVLSIGPAGSSGVVLNGKYNLTFHLYTDSLGVKSIWSATYNTSVESGVFSVLLGTGNKPLPTSQEMDSPLWIGVQVEDGQEMRPLAQLTAAPFALNVVDGAITKNKIARAAVTPDKVSFNYIEELSINGTPVPGQAKKINLQSGNGVDLTYNGDSSTVFFATSTGIWTPEPLMSSVNNYTLNITARYIRLMNISGASINLTGLDHTGIQNGRVILLANIGANPIVLKHRSAMSATENQFIVPGGTDVILAANGTATLQYDQWLQGWVLDATN